MSLIDNKKAYFNYEILKKYEAGIELLGHEVKSVRAGRGSLDGAYVTVDGNNVFLVGATISPYQVGNTPKDYDPVRRRRLLLTAQEISGLAGATAGKGLTIVPIAMYNKGKKIKVELVLARGKKKYDKRETIKKREAGREIDRTLKIGN